MSTAAAGCMAVSSDLPPTEASAATRAKADAYGDIDWLTRDDIKALALSLLTRGVGLQVPSGRLSAAPDDPWWSDLQTQGTLEQVARGQVRGTSAEGLPLCPRDTLWGSEILVGQCSGFVVGHRASTTSLYATAGHCIDSSSDCDRVAFVFPERPDQTRFSPHQIRRCKRVVARMNGPLGAADRLDFALVEIDYAQVPRLISLSGSQPQEAQRVYAIGYPLGMLGLKVAPGEINGWKDPFFFSSSTDLFGGSSGSPVIDARFGELLGVLVEAQVGGARLVDSAGTSVPYQLNQEFNCIELARVTDAQNAWTQPADAFQEILRAWVEGASVVRQSGETTAPSEFSVTEPGSVVSALFELALPGKIASDCRVQIRTPGGVPMPMDTSAETGPTVFQNVPRLRGIQAQGRWRVSIIPSDRCPSPSSGDWALTLLIDPKSAVPGL